MNWRDLAECRGMDPDLFFPERGDTQENYRQLRAICSGCPVRDECREFALASGERDGWYGGMSGRERQSLRRTRRIA